MTLPDIRAAIDQLVESQAADLVAVRRRIHQRPELSNREEQTAALVAGRLADLGLDEIRTGIAGHGVVGVLRGGQPGDRVAAIRADMDALPVREASGVPFASTVVDETYPGGPFPVAHACGHDCHTAVVLTTAAVLYEVRDQLPGTVLFVFQPAEEGPPIGERGGAQAMLDDQALDHPSPTMVFGMHVGSLPHGHVGYRVGRFFAASVVVRIRVTGQQAHGSSPWRGVDPLPPAAEIVTGSSQIYRQVPTGRRITISFGHVQDVGRFNIIGGEVTLWGTIRAERDDDMATVQDRLRRLAEQTAAAHGCTAEVDYLQPVPPVDNTQPWIDAILPTVERIVGADRLVDGPPNMGYDDVSVFLNAFGGAYLTFGVQDTRLEPGGNVVAVEGGRGLAPGHTPGFYAEDGDLATAVRIHAHVVVDHLFGEATLS